MSKYLLLYHAVFNTKNRTPAIPQAHKRELYSYIWAILKNRDCVLHRMNGIENHVHILFSAPPRIALSDLMAEIKRASSIWMKSNPNFPKFYGWGREYFIASVSSWEKEHVSNYIKSQEEHHHRVSYEEEIMEILRECGLE